MRKLGHIIILSHLTSSHQPQTCDDGYTLTQPLSWRGMAAIYHSFALPLCFVMTLWSTLSPSSEMCWEMITALAMKHVCVSNLGFIILITLTAKVFAVAKVNQSKHRACKSHRSGRSATSTDEVRRGDGRRRDEGPGGTSPDCCVPSSLNLSDSWILIFLVWVHIHD